MKLEILKLFKLSKGIIISEIRGFSLLKTVIVFGIICIFVFFSISSIIPAPSFHSERFYYWFWLTSVCILHSLLIYQLREKNLNQTIQFLLINKFSPLILFTFFSFYFFFLSFVFESIILISLTNLLVLESLVNTLTLSVISSIFFSQIGLYVTITKTHLFPVSMLLLGINLATFANSIHASSNSFNILVIFVSFLLIKLNSDTIRDLS